MTNTGTRCTASARFLSAAVEILGHDGVDDGGGLALDRHRLTQRVRNADDGDFPSVTVQPGD